MMVVFIFTLIGVLSFYGILIIVSKFDKENSIIIKKEVSIILIILTSTYILYTRYKLTIKFAFLFYLSIYLIICAYIDYKTMYVYTIFNYITLIVSIFYLIEYNSTLNVTNILISVTIYMVFSVILTKLEVYGGGDNEIFIVTSLFIAVKYNSFPLEALLTNMMLCNIVTLIINFKKFDFKRLRFNESIPYAPSIAISIMILLLV